MNAPTIKQSLADIIAKRFPWLLHVVEVASAQGRGLAIRAAGGLIHLAGGPDDPPVHRKGDGGTAGGFTAGAVPGQLTYTGPDGTSWNLTFQSASAGAPVVIALVPIEGDGGALTTKSTEGSERVTCA